MNSVSLIGRLTRDPEVRYTSENQMAVARFSIAIDRPSRRDGGERQTDFPNIVVFGRQAENCERYLGKGRLVGVQGRLQTGSYTNKDGVKVYTTDVIANNVEFLDWGDRAGRGQDSFSQNQGYAQGSQGGFTQNQGFQQQNQAPQGGSGRDQGFAQQDSQSSFVQEQGNQNPSQGGFSQNTQQANDSVPAGFTTLEDDDIPF